MRKKFALVLIAVMAVVMAAGCSNGDDDTANQTEPSTTVETTAKATDKQDSQQNLISEDKARDIAMKKVKGAKDSDITQFKLDKDDGRQEYEGKLVYDGKEYDFNIDAVSGEVLKWEEETVNK